MTTEQDTMLDLPVAGELTYREWHAAVDGVYSGARWGARSHEYGQEQHYWRIGYLLGTVARYLLVAGIVAWLRRD